MAWVMPAIGAATSIYSAVKGGGGGQNAQAGGAEWLSNPRDEQLSGHVNDFLSRGFQNMNEGRTSDAYNKYAEIEKKKRLKQLQDQYMGGAGGFGGGLLDMQKANDIGAGRAGAGGGSNYAKQLYNYGMGQEAIQDQLTQLGAADMSQQQSQLVPWAMKQQYPEGKWQEYQETPYQPNMFESLMGGVGQIAPYLGGMFGGSKTSGGGSSAGSYGTPGNYGSGSQTALRDVYANKSTTYGGREW